MTTAELRDVDAQIHREVMGVIWDESLCRICGWPIVPEGEQGCWARSCSMRPVPDRRADEPPCYSTDIAAAWRVVKRMREQKWNGTVQVFGIEPGETKCTAIFVSPTRMRSSDAPSAPLAICLAALKAVSPKETSPPQKGDCNA